MAGPGGIRAGAAFVEAYLDDSKLRRGLKGVRAQLAAFGAGVNALGTKFAGLGAGVITPLLAATHHFMSAGSALNDMSARTGVGTNALSELGFAAEQTGASLEDVETGVKRMQKAITAATEGPLKKLQGMSPEEQGLHVAEHRQKRRAAPSENFQGLRRPLRRIGDLRDGFADGHELLFG